MFLGDKNTKYPRNIKHNTTFFQKNEKNIGKDLDEREKTEEVPSLVKEKAKTPEERRNLRSKTFPGFAKAVAEQWGEFLIDEYEIRGK